MTIDPKMLREARRLWNEHGGRPHGPHVETLTMPEDKFEGFINAVIAAHLSALPAAEPMAFMCDGCRRLATDVDADLAELRREGHRSCCPERRMDPLYTHPAPATERDEALEEAAMIVSGFSTAQNYLPEGVNGGWLATRDLDMAARIRALKSTAAREGKP